MSLPVSAAFLEAINANVNSPIYRVNLILGNYGSADGYGTTAASSGDASADYPAAGAIDGDRTEINVGAAGSADNDVGKSSWRSSGVPDNGDTVTLTLTFSQARTINRLKLYHLSAHGLRTFKFSYWNGSSFVDFAATSDIVAGGQVSITTTGELDVVDFPDVSTTKVKLTVTHTQVGSDNANVVELEIYRAVDISTHVKGIQIQRARDYKLGNPLASQITIVAANNGRYFSPNHTPTAAEVALGYVNSELDSGIGIEVEQGFDLLNGPEYVMGFVGTLDKLTITPGTRDAVIEGRDGMKSLVNKARDSSKLKSSSDITALIQYVLNRANISNFECSLDTTNITIPVFFTEAEDFLSVIRDLAQASGDSIFFFDENGKAVFKFFSPYTNQSKTYTTEADWEAGSSFTAIDTTTIPDKIIYKYFTPETWNNSTSGWSVNILYSGVFDVDAEGLRLAVYPGNVSGEVYRNIGAFSVGDSECQFRWEENYTSTPLEYFFSHGYKVVISPRVSPHDITVSLIRISDSLNLGSYNAGLLFPSTWHTVRVRRTQAGNMMVYFDGILAITATDTTDPCTASFDLKYFFGGTGTLHIKSNYPNIPTTSGGVGVWGSDTIDCTSSVISYGHATSTSTLNGGSVALATRSSADGTSWDAWVNVDGTGQILSTVRRYLQVRVSLTIAAFGDSPSVNDVTVNWTTGATTPKYPSTASFSISFDSIVLNVYQELAGNVGGDSSIINDASVQAQPMILNGADSDTVWQGTVGTPPVPISVTDPLTVTNGSTLTYSPTISGGMDIANMSGSNPVAAVVTFVGGATGSWSFSSINPTRPVLKIVITHDGTITDLRLAGKVYGTQTAYTGQETSKADAASISKYGDCQFSVSNKWISDPAVADSIAHQLVDNFKAPVAYLPSCTVRPMPAVQIGDRITVTDDNLDLSADYIAIGVSHNVQSSEGNAADANTDLVLMKIPAGF